MRYIVLWYAVGVWAVVDTTTNQPFGWFSDQRDAITVADAYNEWL